jgi:hypothetical protein
VGNKKHKNNIIKTNQQQSKSPPSKKITKQSPVGDVATSINKGIDDAAQS